MLAGLYARVSTHDRQTLGLQLRAMTTKIRNRGWDLARQVKDVGSGRRIGPGASR
jgi:putative DNA-invertase from lambdoid prophage Rac